VRPACVDSSVYNGGNETGNCEGYTGFLAAFDTTQSGQSSLKYATYIGGPEFPGGNSSQNQVLGLAADSANNVYLTGLTTSASYPTTVGAYQTACQQVRGSVGQPYCNQSAFLTKINPTGTEYVWSTLFEGTQQSIDYGQNIGFDTNGNVFLYGYDNNYTFDLPWVNPLQGRPGSNSGASYPFLATFSPDGSRLLFSTPLGNVNPNAGNDFPVGMVLDSANNIYFAGYGADNGSMAATPETTYATAALGGSNRTYFGKISPVFAPSGTTLIISPPTATTGQTVTFTATVAGTTQSTPTPTGTVTLTNISTTPAATLGTITLASGTGQFTTSALAVGSYSVTGSYSGDSNYVGSTSSPQSLTVSAPVAPPSIAVTASGLVYSRVTQTYSGTVTLKNTGTSAVAGPFQLLFTSLTAGVTLVNATGILSGTPYLTVPGVSSLSPGQSATVSVHFKNPSNVTIKFTPVVQEGGI
jgi:hypothetical protein